MEIVRLFTMIVEEKQLRIDQNDDFLTDFRIQMKCEIK